jgi:hypothetical protein
MNFRVFTFLLTVSITLVQCSANKNSGKAWQNSMLESYYSIWSTGMAPAGTGANFFVKLDRTDKIDLNSFSVNGEDLEFEIEQTETETLIIGRKYTGPDFEARNQEMAEFYRQEKYSGVLSFTAEGKSLSISISSFERREPGQQNL